MTDIFWKWFTDNSEQMTMLDDLEEGNRQSLLDDMQATLDGYHEGLSFEIGEQTPGGRTLTFSAEGDTELFKYVSDLVESAPDVDWWEFVAFKQPKGKALKVSFDKYRFDTSKMYFMQLESEESPDMVGLRVAVDNPVEDDDQLVGVYVTIEALIGEFDCATLVGYLELCSIPKEPMKEGFQRMDDLPEFIEWFKNRG